MGLQMHDGHPQPSQALLVISATLVVVNGGGRIVVGNGCGVVGIVVVAGGVNGGYC